MIEKLIKNFQIFCKMCDGEYRIEVFPECIKTSFKISFEYLEKENILAHLMLKIVSEEGDFEVLKIENVKILDIKRYSGEDLRYYNLEIITNKGVLLLRRDLREDKLIIELKGDDIWYKSAVIF